MRRIIASTLVFATLAGGVFVSLAPAVEQDFEAVFGQLVFEDAQARQQGRTIIEKYVGRQNFTPPTITDVPAGKYGAGPALLVTLRLETRADADEVWTDVTRAVVLNRLRATSVLRQSSVVFDAELGTQTVTEIHKLTVPAAPDDF